MILRRDPVWCVHALGDLAAPMFANTQWFSARRAARLDPVQALRMERPLQK